MPPQRRNVVRLLVEHATLELGDQLAALVAVGRPALGLVELVEHGVLVPRIVLRALVGGDELGQLEVGLLDAATLEVDADLVVTGPKVGEVRPGLLHDLLDVEADLAPLVHQEDTDRLEWHRDVPVLVGEGEPLGNAGLSQQPSRLAPRGLDVLPEAGDRDQLGLGGGEVRAGHHQRADRLHDGDARQRPRALPASDGARRTRGSLNGLRSWLSATYCVQSQLDSWTAIRSPRARTSSSRVDGGKPRNSAWILPPRSAATRAAVSLMKSARKPSRYGRPLMK